MGGMRTSSDSVPIVLILTTFALMFIGETSYERLTEAWLLAHIEPWLGAGAAEVAERFSAFAVAGILSLSVTAALYIHLRRQFARAAAQLANGSPARALQRDVWLYDAICRIFLGHWEAIALKAGRLDLDSADAPVLRDLVSRHIRQLAADGTLPIWGRGRGNWALWELAPPEFWRHHRVDYQSFLEADPRLLHALPCRDGDRMVSFGELMTSKAAVDAFCESVAL
jgi:hypothetical protein